jgi:hypothetical protein
MWKEAQPAISNTRGGTLRKTGHAVCINGERGRLCNESAFCVYLRVSVYSNVLGEDVARWLGSMKRVVLYYLLAGERAV